jgi:peptide/nickel transport system substrate-binding protein
MGGVRRRRLLAAGAAAALATACRGTARQSAGNRSAGGSGSARYGGQLNVAAVDEPGNGGNFDPANKRTSGSFIFGMTHNALLNFKLGSDVKYTDVIVQPDLADRWESPDAQTFTFHLANARFQALAPVNGRQLTSADVKWTYQYLTRLGPFGGLPPSGAASLFAGLDRVDTPDDATAVMHFGAPFAPFLTYAATPFAPIVPHEIFDSDGDLTKQLVGSGPFQLDAGASESGKRWIWRKNAGNFHQGHPYLDQVNWLILRDGTTQLAAFETKQLDVLVLDGLTADNVQQVKGVVPSAVTYAFPNPRSTYIYMNTATRPLNDQRIRQAFSFAMDRDEFIQVLEKGKGEWALAASLPGLFTEQETKQILKFDPAQAKQLVDAAGYPSGVDVELVYVKSSDRLVTLLQLLQAQVKKAGINIKLLQVEEGVDSNRRRSGDYQLSITAGPPSLTADNDSILYPLFYPGDPGNRGKVDDPTLSPLLTAQRQETDPAKRREIIRQAVRRINELSWSVSTHFGTAYEMSQSYVANYGPNLGADQRVNDCWLDRAS